MTLVENQDLRAKQEKERKPGMHRLLRNALMVKADGGFVYETGQQLADASYQGRPGATKSLPAFAGLIGYNLVNPNHNLPLYESLRAIVDDSFFEGMTPDGVVKIIKRDIDFDQAVELLERINRESGQPPAPQIVNLATEVFVESESSNPAHIPSVAPEPEALKDTRTLSDAHLYRLLDFFSSMTVPSMAFYGLEIPRDWALRMVEVMARMRETNPLIVQQAKAESLTLSQILREFPLDESDDSKAKRRKFLAANEDKLARNLLRVMKTSRRPESYDILLSNLHIVETHPIKF